MINKSSNQPIGAETKIVFFGTPIFAVYVLEELKKSDIIPSLIVTTPDKPQGRKLIITPTPTKEWAMENNVPVLQPAKLDDDFKAKLKSGNYDLAIVAAYGKILPQSVLDIPKYGFINVHPSLLPKFRGASPIESAMLSDEEKTGTTIMVVDAKMDHGAILAQKELDNPTLSYSFEKIEKELAVIGGRLLIDVIPKWISGEIAGIEQNHDEATFTNKITKEDGLIDLNDDPNKNYKKIKAFAEWPKTYFFTEKNGRKMRVIIKDAEIKDGELVIKRIIPEGKKEIDYSDFLKN
jgi:methionyl-tRNA formyltransferase